MLIRTTPPSPAEIPALLVVCLCAQWCGTCRDYQAVFVDAQARFRALARFDQIDVENEAELLDDVEIENFPTLLIVRGERVLFFGTITPHAQTLPRLVAGAHAGTLDPPASPPPIAALARRVMARAQFRRG